jgi:hypothetical protein
MFRGSLRLSLFPCFDRPLSDDAQISGLPRTLGGLLRFPKGDLGRQEDGPEHPPAPSHQHHERYRPGRVGPPNRPPAPRAISWV